MLLINSNVTYNFQLPINLQLVHCKRQIKYFFRQGLVNLTNRCAPKETAGLTRSSLASLLVDGLQHGRGDSGASVPHLKITETASRTLTVSGIEAVFFNHR